MDPSWVNDGPSKKHTVHERDVDNSTAGPSRVRTRIKTSKPFVSAHHKPDNYDGVFRVVVITSGSVASVKLPLIVGALCKNENIDVQVVATQASRHFYNQDQVDEEVRAGSGPDVNSDAGVRVWTDADEWSDWKKLGDPILHIELRRWADLVVVAPCSADFLAKLASGLSDNLPLSLLRALPPTTPVILCPAMNTHMYTHPFTTEHLLKLQDKLGYLISGPQGAGMLACGDEGPGKMTDWKDIVEMIESFANVFHLRHESPHGMERHVRDTPRIPKALNPPISLADSSDTVERDGSDMPMQGYSGDLSVNVRDDDYTERTEGKVNPIRGWDTLWPGVKQV